MNIREMVENYKDEIIEKTRKLVSYESVQCPPQKNYPFGKAVADCLDSALAMCNEYGFKTVNLDNYVGYAEIGEGEKLILNIFAKLSGTYSLILSVFTEHQYVPSEHIWGMQ